MHESLLDGMVNFGCGGHDGCGALSGFVAIDAAFDAPCNGGAYDAAQRLVVAKGGGYHVAESTRHGGGVDYQHHDGENDVGDGHEGCDDFGHLGDTLYPAQHDEGNEGGNGYAHYPGGDMECGREGLGNAVAVDGRQTESAGQNGGDGKDDGQPGAVEPFLDVVGGAATQLVAVMLFVNLCQAGFGIGGASPKECDNPHPDDGSGAAESDGQGHTDDVACAHATRKGEGESLEGGDAGTLAAVVLEEQAHHLAQVAHLHKTGAKGEIECGSQAESYERPAPDAFVEESYYLIHIVSLLIVWQCVADNFAFLIRCKDNEKK